MKKIIIALLILSPFSIFAAGTTSAPWIATSTPSSFIQPANINGVIQALKVSGVATSTINKLEVGNLNVTTGATMPAAISLSGFTTGSALFVGPSGTIAQDNANYFWDDTNNRLGVGTITPNGRVSLGTGTGAKFLAYDNNSTIFSGLGVDMGEANAITLFGHGQSGTGFINFGFAGNTTGTIASGFTEKMRITYGGNVGIGTTSPNSQLHVYGVGQLVSTLTDAGAKTGTLNITGASGSAGAGGALTFSSVNDNGTNVPQYAIKSLLQNGGGNGVGRLAFSGRVNTSDTSLTEFATILSNGNVGIGTTTPAAKLSVVNVAAGATGAIYPTNSVARFEYGGGNGVISLAGNSSSDMGYVFSSPSGAYDGVVGYNTGTRSMNLNTAGSERVRITSSGNVGIGTTNPQSNLQIGSGSANVTTTIQSANGGNTTLDLVENNGTAIAPWYGGRIKYSGTSDIFQIGTVANDVETMAISIPRGSGNVGIGTTNPASVLEVSGNNPFITIDGQLSGNRGINFYHLGTSIGSIAQDSGSGSLRFNAGPSAAWGGEMDFIIDNTITALKIDTSGNVGIGTVAPGTKLEVNGGITKLLNAGAQLRTYYDANLMSEVSTRSDGNLQIYAYNGSAYKNILLGVDGSTIGGNVGIGTTSPWAQLSINPNGITGPAFAIGSSTATRLVVTNGGNVGIGTAAPSGLLTLKGTSSGAPASGDANFRVKFSDPGGIANDLGIGIDSDSSIWLNSDSVGNGGMTRFTFGGTENVRFLANGNVGIGTTTINSKLVVQGDAYLATSTAATASGLIMVATDGTCHRIVVSTLNVISASTVSCP